MESNKAYAAMELEAIPSKTLPLKPVFKPLRAHEMSEGKFQERVVRVPDHRMHPLNKAWKDVFPPICDQMQIDVKMDPKARKVFLRTTPSTPDISNLQKCCAFVHALTLGFDVTDAISLLRIDELFIESFEINDVKTLRGEHQSRAIGRLSGRGRRTKFAIENATNMRIVIANTKIHILGSFKNIKVARNSLCSLILGSPAGKVYSKLRTASTRFD